MYHCTPFHSSSIFVAARLWIPNILLNVLTTLIIRLHILIKDIHPPLCPQQTTIQFNRQKSCCVMWLNWYICACQRLINLVFISWQCLCLPCSHAYVRQCRRPSNEPATGRRHCKLEAAGGVGPHHQPHSTVYQLDLWSQLSLLITSICSVALLENHTFGVLLVFGVASSHFPKAAPAAGWRGGGRAKGQNDITGISESYSEDKICRIQTLWVRQHGFI